MRITIAQLPALLREIVVASLGQASDVEIVENPEEPMELPDLVASTRPDFLVVGCERQELRRLCDQLLRRHGDLKLIGISRDGRRAHLCELRPHEVELLDVSPQRLLEAIRRPGNDGVTA